MKKQRKRITTYLIVLGLICIISGLSFAVFQYSKTGKYAYKGVGGFLDLRLSSMGNISVAGLPSPGPDTSLMSYEFSIYGTTNNDYSLFYGIDLLQTSGNLKYSDICYQLWEFIDGVHVLASGRLGSKNFTIHNDAFPPGSDNERRHYFLDLWISDQVLLTDKPSNYSNYTYGSVYTDSTFSNYNATFKIQVNASASHDRQIKLVAGKGTSKGDIIAVNGLNYSVIKNDGKYLTLFAKDSYTKSAFANTKYWLDSSNNLLSKYGSSFPVDVFDENSLIYPILENYKKELISTGIYARNVRLLNKNDLMSLGVILGNLSSAAHFGINSGNELVRYYAENNEFTYVGYVHNSSGALGITGSGLFDSESLFASTSSTSVGNVRPVIEIPIDYVTGLALQSSTHTTNEDPKNLKIGDSVEIGTEKFYVINNSGNKYTLFAAKNLDTLMPSTSTATSKKSYLAYQGTGKGYQGNNSGTQIVKLNSNGTTKKNGEYKGTEVWLDTAFYLEFYKRNLAQLGTTVIDVRLPKLEEVKSLGVDNVSGKLPKFAWANDTNYWIGFCNTDTSSYVVNSDGYLDTVSIDTYGGIRPVVEIYKDQVSYYESRVSLSEVMLLDNKVANSSTLDFSSKNGNGLYVLNETRNNEHPIYFYRGNVTNNNVIYGNYCWKIVRTTETGGVKLIYNGAPSSGKCVTTSSNDYNSNSISTSAFNVYTNSAAYEGFMYYTTSNYKASVKTASQLNSQYVYGKDVIYANGKYTLTDKITSSGNFTNDYNDTSVNGVRYHHYTCFSSSDNCSTVYYVYLLYDDGTNGIKAYYYPLSGGKTHLELLNEMLNGDGSGYSTIYDTLNTWYMNHLNGLSSEIEDTPFCNDRSVYNYGGWDINKDNVNSILFGSYGRLVANKAPTLVCPNKDDSYTTDTKYGNGHLFYPIGLLTADEAALAGLVSNVDNTSNYLYNNHSQWLMSPFDFNSGGAGQFAIYSGASLSSSRVHNTNRVRPVISINNDVEFDYGYCGTGTATDPYHVHENPQ